MWYEVARQDLGLDYVDSASAAGSGRTWFPLNKGGERRRWFGNQEYVINWRSDGAEIRSMVGSGPRGNATIRNTDRYFLASVGWTMVSSHDFSARFYPAGHLFGSGGGGIFALDVDELLTVIAVLNSNVMNRAVNRLSPTINFDPGPVSRFPIAAELFDGRMVETSKRLVELHRIDWNRRETSWRFQRPEVLSESPSSLLRNILHGLMGDWRSQIEEVLILERRTNEIAASVYGIEAELDLEVDQFQLTLDILPGLSLDQIDDDAFLSDVAPRLIGDLISYAVGCMFGRYSLDLPGLIIADQGATIQDYLSKVATPTFHPNADNAIPFVDDGWFEDDIVERVRQFLRVAFGVEHFEENLRLVEESLGVKTLRDYFITKAGKSKFYEDHVQRYKKRPIYWMFSSPEGSFNALIYMHRYNPSTVSTVLNEYLREYRAKLEAALVNAEYAAAGGSAVKAQYEPDRLRKVLAELRDYEHDVLYPLATQQIEIDLDDGVKVNYPKFYPALKKIPQLGAKDE
jgi:hypothetical protein